MSNHVTPKELQIPKTTWRLKINWLCISIKIIDQHQLIPSKWIKEYWILFQVKDVSFICPNFGLNVSFIQDSSSNFSRGSCLKDTAGVVAWIVSAGKLPLPTASFAQQAPFSMSGPVYRTLIRIQTLHTAVSPEHRSNPWIHLAVVFVRFFHKRNVPTNSTNPTRVSWHAQMHTIQNIPLRSLRSSREMASESLVLISSQMALKPLMSMMPQLLDLDTDSTGKPNMETLMPNQRSKNVVSPWFSLHSDPCVFQYLYFASCFRDAFICFHHQYMS